VKRDSGGSALVPFRKEFVGEIDEEKGELEILSSWILE
jgi:ribosomal 30S subunit maturation factor RimM